MTLKQVHQEREERKALRRRFRFYVSCTVCRRIVDMTGTGGCRHLETPFVCDRDECLTEAIAGFPNRPTAKPSTDQCFGAENCD